MMSGISGSGGGYTSQMQGMQRRQGQGQGQGERFNQLDADGNGSLDQTELQSMGDKVSEVTGQQLNVTELSKAYDSNNDGALAKDEMQAMMVELSDSMDMTGMQGGQSSQQSLAAYQANSEEDLTSTLLDILGESDDNKEEEESYNPLDLQA